MAIAFHVEQAPKGGTRVDVTIRPGDASLSVEFLGASGSEGNTATYQAGQTAQFRFTGGAEPTDWFRIRVGGASAFPTTPAREQHRKETAATLPYRLFETGT